MHNKLPPHRKAGVRSVTATPRGCARAHRARVYPDLLIAEGDGSVDVAAIRSDAVPLHLRCGGSQMDSRFLLNALPRVCAVLSIAFQMFFFSPLWANLKQKNIICLRTSSISARTALSTGIRESSRLYPMAQFHTGYGHSYDCLQQLHKGAPQGSATREYNKGAPHVSTTRERYKGSATMERLY